MAGSIWDWSRTAASNGSSDAAINWLEGQAAFTVNDSARQMMGRQAEFLADLGCTVSTGGSANAHTLTARSGFLSLATGIVVGFKAGFTNTGAVTLNVNLTGAKAIRKFTTSEEALVKNDIVAGGLYVVVYDATVNGGAGGWVLIFTLAQPYIAPGGTLPITVSKKLDEVVAVTGWMTTVYDDTADHTTWLQNVVEKVNTELGGANVGIYMPHALYNISDTILIPYDNITFIGRGHGADRNSTVQTRASPKTRILFKTGSTPAPMFQFAPSNGADWYVLGGGLRDIMLDGNNLATRCLSILTCRYLRFQDLHCFAATAANIFTGQVTFVLTHPVYGSAYHSWDRIRSHASSFAANAAYALRMEGGLGPSSPDNSTINQFRDCQFTSELNHAVSLQNADGHEFYGGAMTSHGGGAALAGGLATGFAGLELCSSSQSTGFGNGVCRNTRFFGTQINDTIIRAGQGGGNSPHEIEFYGSQYGNAGGFFFVETAAGGSPAPHAIVYDQKNGIVVYGNSVNAYKLHGIDHMHMVDGVSAPAAETGYVKQYVDSGDGSTRIKHADGTIRVLSPGPTDTALGNVILAKTVNTLTNFAGAGAGTLTNAPTAGAPTKWIKINDNGTTRYIPTWT